VRHRLADVAPGLVPVSEGKCQSESWSQGTWTQSGGALDRSGAPAGI
jgi:hypothetical protein